MTKNELFKNLFIFEMANNHMGDVGHGLRIIREMREVCKGFDFKFGFKLQYRDLDTFIHPDFRKRNDIKYVKRFMETRLTEEEMKALKDEIQKMGFISICTPFDENSVDRIEKHGFDIIKIASCSLTDWPLLERIVKTKMPVIASTAGSSLEEIDRVASFLEHRQFNFALMHCVAEYPTEMKNIQLNQIDLLRSRYPQINIGYSTHEAPDNQDTIKMAIAKGASIFEKHVGVPTAEFALNGYSASPSQIQNWLQSASDAFVMCGGTDGRRPGFPDAELASLHSLRRGVFAKRSLIAGEKVSLEDVSLAIPLTDNQITANDLSKYTEFYLQEDIEVNKPLLFLKVKKIDKREKVYEIVNRVKVLLDKNNIVTPGKAEFEISHHYGIERFDEVGITMITIVNREYCKKLIIVLPGQKHPEQFHKQKEETFYILAGEVLISLDGVEKEYHKGDAIVVETGVRHSFTSKTGGVIEEISSTHYKDDSYYTDPEISKNKNRKTSLTYWI